MRHEDAAGRVASTDVLEGKELLRYVCVQAVDHVRTKCKTGLGNGIQIIRMNASSSLLSSSCPSSKVKINLFALSPLGTARRERG